MKKHSTAAALLLVGALALAGCTASPEPAPEAATATPLAAQQVASLDVDAARAEAIAAGRPEAAWDKNCVAWELPAADTEGQAWANELGTAWMDFYGAECPDAITWPNYFVESLNSQNGKGLEVVVDSSITDTDWGHVDGNERHTDLHMIARGIMEVLGDDYPELTGVTGVTDDNSREATYSRADLEHSRAVEAGEYVYP